MLSAICFNLDQCTIFSSDDGLRRNCLNGITQHYFSHKTVIAHIFNPYLDESKLKAFTDNKIHAT